MGESRRMSQYEFEVALGIRSRDPVREAAVRARRDAGNGDGEEMSVAEAGRVLERYLLEPAAVPRTKYERAKRVAGESLRTSEAVRVAQLEATFRGVGLSESAAAGAARGLVSGSYFSFEDAAASQALFDRDSNLDKAKMRAAADRFRAERGR